MTMSSLRQGKSSTKIHKGKPEKSRDIQVPDNVIAILLFILSLPIRLKHITQPEQVIFDEVHFGVSISNYIKGTFFFDVNPPLAKLLITLVAWISGFDGQFDFSEIGREYTGAVPYVQMRTLGALFGTGVVPLAYLTIRHAGHSKMAAILSALAICFENGLITNNRLILLDSYLLFFTAFSIFAWIKFYNQKSFSRSWWLWLSLTGVGLGCTVSSKWVGLFTPIAIGISASKQLWELLGNVQVSKRQYIRHLFARCISLVLVPTLIYLGTFYIHFSLLTKPGSGDHFMSIETQYELKGEPPIDTPAPVTYGSLITIRHVATSGGYLHSHLANYPEGSNQQQVTLYPFRDTNNWWRIIRVTDDEATNSTTHDDLLAKDNTTWLQYVRDGDLVILEHVNTAPRKLHSHDVPAPVTDTDYHFEVSGYGFVDHPGDSNDFWRVVIEKDNENDTLLQSRRTRFRLLHTNQNCHLYSTPERLPDWGFQQQEVSCIFDGLKPKTIWTIDQTQNELLPENVTMVPEPRPGFLSKLARINRAMWTVSHELPETHPFESRPHAWPVLRSYVPFWLSDDTAIILAGNPVVFWASTISVLTCMTLFGFLQLRAKRGFKDTFHGLRACYYSAGFFVMGWVLHYVPFYFMQRPLFLHHYMPALYFAVLTLGVVVDGVQRRFPQSVQVAGSVAIVACIVYAYVAYAPITYGEPWSVEACEQAELLESWDFHCTRYAPAESLERLELYEQEGTVETQPSQEKEEEFMYEPEEEEEEVDMYEPEEEEEEEDVPTDAPVFEEPEPDFIDGKEVFGTDEDEDEYPRTRYGYEPDEEDQVPATMRQIPVTKAND